MALDKIVSNFRSLLSRAQAPEQAENAPPQTGRPGSSRTAAAAALRSSMPALLRARTQSPANARFSAATPAAAPAPLAGLQTGMRQRVRRQFASLQHLARKCACFMATRTDLQPGSPIIVRPAAPVPASAALPVPAPVPLPVPFANPPQQPAPAAVSLAAPPITPPAPAVITNRQANQAFRGMKDAASLSLQEARALQQATAANLVAANIALDAVPVPTAAELAARSGPAQTVFEEAIRQADVAWEAIARPRRIAANPEGPNLASYRPPAGPAGARYQERWDRAGALHDTALRQARQVQQDALDPQRAAAMQAVHSAQAADTVAAAAVDTARAHFLQIATLEIASR
jgi:hypothetical protein